MTGTVIRIRPEHLLRALALLLAVVAIPLGIAHTPYLHGRATLLTPERRDIMRYLDRAAGWADGLGREVDTLQRILEEATRDPGAGRLLDLGQTGTQALERLAGLAQQTDSAQVPPAEGALHRDLCDAVAVELQAAQDVLACVGAPSQDALALAQQDLADARGRVGTLQDVIRQQQAALAQRGDSDGQ
jgi:hypothetical protein